MSNEKKESYFNHHFSLSQWVQELPPEKRDRLIHEDADKRRRLSLLQREIGLPIVDALTLTGSEVIENSKRFAELLEIEGSIPYAVRATPKEKNDLPVLRNRGQKLTDLADWLLASGANLNDYNVNFERHIVSQRAVIFVVTDDYIVGEAIEGGILTLNKGEHRPGESLEFRFDFENWEWSRPSGTLEDFVRSTVDAACPNKLSATSEITSLLDVSISHGYLVGYYEAIWSELSGVIFIDYNRELTMTVSNIGSLLSGKAADSDPSQVVGLGACEGQVQGIARVVLGENIAESDFKSGDILVCEFTSPAYLGLMNAASAVVTDVGGILSHAAILCRELGKPCVVGTGNATNVLATGDELLVDGGSGTVTKVAH